MMAWPFTATASSMRGDVNGDSEVNIADVTRLIDYLLSPFFLR